LPRRERSIAVVRSGRLSHHAANRIRWAHAPRERDTLAKRAGGPGVALPFVGRVSRGVVGRFAAKRGLQFPQSARGGKAGGRECPGCESEVAVECPCGSATSSAIAIVMATRNSTPRRLSSQPIGS
jgi:hypothetical protein